MRKKVTFNMSSVLKRSKIYFLAVAILSVAIVLVSYNWNVRENIYKISRDISLIKKAPINLPTLKFRDRSLQTVLHVSKSGVTTQSWTRSKEADGSEEKRDDKKSRKGNDVMEMVEKGNSKMNASLQANANNSVDRLKKTDNATYTRDTKSFNESRTTIQLNKLSENSTTFRKNSSYYQIGEKLHTKESVTKNKENAVGSSENGSDVKSINSIRNSGKKAKFSRTTTPTLDRNDTKLNNIKFSKKETQEILDKIRKLRNDIRGNRNKTTDLQMSRSSQIKSYPDNHNNAQRVERLKKFGLAGNFINPVLWMSKDNQEYYNSLDPGVTSRPDACVGCFVDSFRKMINEPDICKGDTDLLILITSSVDKRDSRDAIRDTWCAKCNGLKSKIKYVFVFGNKNDSEENSQLLKESKEYHDIIQMDFNDTYANLTYKTISSFKWSKDFCPKAKYVMKTDDDMYVNTELLPLLLKAAPSEKFMGGMCWGPSSPHRDMTSKWYVSFVQYRHSLFPSMCSGTGYVMSRDTVAGILRQAPNVPFFHLEDVYVAICVKRLGINPVMLDGFKNIFVEFDPCLYRNTLITSHEVSADKLYFIWRKRKTCPLRDLKPEYLFNAFPV